MNDDIHLDQYVVIDESGEICIYHHWFQDYTPERIRKELGSQPISSRGSLE